MLQVKSSQATFNELIFEHRNEHMCQHRIFLSLMQKFMPEWVYLMKQIKAVLFKKVPEEFVVLFIKKMNCLLISRIININVQLFCDYLQFLILVYQSSILGGFRFFKYVFVFNRWQFWTITFPFHSNKQITFSIFSLLFISFNFKSFKLGFFVLLILNFFNFFKFGRILNIFLQENEMVILKLVEKLRSRC